MPMINGFHAFTSTQCTASRSGVLFHAVATWDVLRSDDAGRVVVTEVSAATADVYFWFPN